MQKNILTLLFISVSILRWQPLCAYTFCNESEKAINVLVFASENDVADFLNRHNFSEDQGGTTITINLQATQSEGEESLKNNERSDLPYSGWIRLSYSSEGSDAYLKNNNAIKTVHELGPKKCFSENTKTVSQSDTSKTTDVTLHFLIFETNAIMKKNTQDRTEYHVHLLEIQTSNSEEELSFV